ncbi:hypothetical protein SDC9_138443 [bioreactor metagenome]|uniref:Uncharacterized protein n=1 Tax=bioreactor metagenome TaxID=1076179 RepID=A0A645DPX5_9ZZZZ
MPGEELEAPVHVVIGEVRVPQQPLPVAPGAQLRVRKEDPPVDQHLEDGVVVEGRVGVPPAVVQKVIQLQLMVDVRQGEHAVADGEVG